MAIDYLNRDNYGQQQKSLSVFEYTSENLTNSINCYENDSHSIFIRNHIVSTNLHHQTTKKRKGLLYLASTISFKAKRTREKSTYVMNKTNRAKMSRRRVCYEMCVNTIRSAQFFCHDSAVNIYLFLSTDIPF